MERTAPIVDCEKQHPSLAVTDVREAVDFYVNKLGFKLGFLWGDPPEMSGVNLGDVQMFLHQGKPSRDGCSVFFVVGDADELFDFQKANGVEVVREPGDRPWGLRDYRIRDLHGYELGFGHYLFAGEPLKIERVDVPVRLEKRLAALLVDLAAHKRMTIDSCLEEILLHTCERLGDDGVPSPHTKRTLRYIQELKKKHGIDYDCHASYHFVE